MVSSLSDIPERVKRFLKTRWDGQSPLLLGYSGGPDSKALLYAAQEIAAGSLHLAHVDHGWRAESGEEAEILRKEAKILGCPFHTIRLKPQQKGNQEDLARQARLQFFGSLFEKIPFQALLLAHQADDLAETALKRVLEGAHLPFLGGMEPVSCWEKMAIWRPFLSISKEEIEAFLKARNLKPFLDSTNLDTAYLRARMRLEILPSLNQSFGKRVDRNLALLSERASELRSYLDRKIEPMLGKVEKDSRGVYIPLAGMERLEQRHLLMTVCKEEKISLSRSILETLLDWIEKKASGRRIKAGRREVLAVRGGVWLLPEELKPPISFVATASYSG